MTTPHLTLKPVLLCILDGWGERSPTKDNAISNAHTPFWDDLQTHALKSRLATSGLAVGLPDGQMGNSEVGHMNIGSGRVVMQNLPRIDEAFAKGDVKVHPFIQEAMDALKQSGKTCHIMGLLSDGGVHSHQSHIQQLAVLFAKEGIAVKIHVISDGRDTPPSSGLDYLQQLETAIDGYDSISIASLSGRYYAMDRDHRWDRVQRAYDVVVCGEGTRFKSAGEAIKASYDHNVNDEFIEPVVIGDHQEMEDDDVCIMANFRADRAREILTALVDPDFNGFTRSVVPKFSHVLGMVEYSSALNPYIRTLFPPQKLEDILGQVVADHGLKQLRIAETEKYAHVTFFFNGGREENFLGEERILVPSPQVATYDLQPEMSAVEVTDRLVKAINEETFDLIVVNYANTDMVGHTGNYQAALRAVETVDACLKRVHEAVVAKEGAMLITADHGNAEQMQDAHGNPYTAHTNGPVPLLLTGDHGTFTQLEEGSLCDIAPTILTLMNITQPPHMTGKALVA